MAREQSMNRSTRKMHAAHAPWSVRPMLWMLRRLEKGRLEIVFPNGGIQRIEGAEPGPRARLEIKNARLLRTLLRNGEVGFGEAYMDGDWDSPDLAALLQLLALNEQPIFGAFERNNLLVRALHGIGHWMRSNTRRGSRRNIAYHYDLGNEFYRLWLDETLTYSCAVWARPEHSLVQAQRHKYQLMLERLDLQPGHHVLEIGCGWGGFALYAAEVAGCRVTGITLSREQLAEARSRARAKGLEDRVEFKLMDYRDVEGRYDRIVSIEMYEAVGRRYWPVYFQTVARSLAPGGRAAIQGITMDPDNYDIYTSSVDFIQKHIFPGGMLATPRLLVEHARQAGLAPDTPSRYGLHYADTLALWHRRVLQQRSAIVSQFDERFLRMWRYYLAYCECGFRIGRVDLLQIGLHKPA